MTPQARLSLPEFIAMTATLIATIAVAMDAMLPAIPEIAAELTPEAPNRASFVILSFLLGMGAGTLFSGPLSDRYGRKSVLLIGALLFCLASLWSYFAVSMTELMVARILQGLGASGSRIVAAAMVRDLYSGRRMAQVISFVMAVFILMPAVAPIVGDFIISRGTWRDIFLAFILFSALSSAWLAFRQAETLAPENVRPFSGRSLIEGCREALSHKRVRLSILVQICAFGILFSSLVGTQPIFDQTFDKAESFPIWFAIIALLAGTGNLLNALLVPRLGMRYMVDLAFRGQLVLSGVLAVITYLDAWPPGLLFPAYIAWTVSIFFIIALTIGNLNALALEPLGHLAGTASSLMGACATIGSIAIAAPVALAFDGTPFPLMLGTFLAALAGTVLMRGLTDET